MSAKTLYRYSPDQPVTPPAKSPIHLERDGDHLTIVLPPAGVVRGSSGLFFFAVLWCAFMAAFSTFTIVGFVSSGQIDSGLFFFIAFNLLFWGIGIGMMVMAINMGRRRAIIDVLDETLLVNRASMFGTKQHQWDRSEIKRIIVGSSGMEVNGKPVMELQVHTRDAKKRGMFTGRSDEELKWIAWQIGHALRLEADRSDAAQEST